MAVTATSPANVAVIFGTSRRLSALLWAVICCSNLVLLLLDPIDGAPPPGAWVSWALISVAAAAALFPSGDPLAPRWTAVGTFAAVVALGGLVWDPPSEVSGFAPWYLRSAVTVLVVIVLRRRPAAGWIGTALIAATVLIWASSTGEDVGRWFGLLERQIAGVILVQILAIGLARAARTVAAYRSEESARVRSQELREAAIRERRTELTAIRGLVTPLLTRIARGEVGPALRADAILAEGALRDVLRGRRLAGEPLTMAVLGARRRGVDVTVLDDLGDGDLGPGELDDVERAEALTWAADLVRRASGATVTVRLSRRAGRPLVTVLAADDDIASREF